MSFDGKRLQRIIEGALFAAGETLTISRIQTLFEEHEMPEKEDVLSALEALQHRASERGFELVEVASGWRYQVPEELALWVNRLWEEKPQKYSRAMLETLSLIAYRQPITRGDIEDVRGVAVSSYIIKSLLEREWVKVIGHRDVPGRPSLYATTKTFLDYFNMKSLEDLPSLSELKDLDSLNAPLDLDADSEGAKESGASEACDKDNRDSNREVENTDNDTAKVLETTAGSGAVLTESLDPSAAGILSGDAESKLEVDSENNTGAPTDTVESDTRDTGPSTYGAESALSGSKDSSEEYGSHTNDALDPDSSEETETADLSDMNSSPERSEADRSSNGETNETLQRHRDEG